ncbi:MAG: hypothetical protein LBL99_03730, partial [Holosporaceae bacterium]|nr:hypothetical protein [Holosporaceae bacterium]
LSCSSIEKLEKSRRAKKQNDFSNSPEISAFMECHGVEQRVVRLPRKRLSKIAEEESPRSHQTQIHPTINKLKNGGNMGAKIDFSIFDEVA